MDDNEIVNLYFERDEDAILHTKEKYGSRLRLLSYRIVNDTQIAEECENDTYVQAWNSIPPNEPRSYMYAFLARIIRNLSLNRCRNQNRLKRNASICELSEELEECLPSPDDVEGKIDDMAFSAVLNKFLGELSEEKRNVFLRRYWYTDSISDISKRFDFSETKVKTILFRCRNKLREYLEKEGFTV